MKNPEFVVGMDGSVRFQGKLVGKIKRVGDEYHRRFIVPGKLLGLSESVTFEKFGEVKAAIYTHLKEVEQEPPVESVPSRLYVHRQKCRGQFAVAFRPGNFY